MNAFARKDLWAGYRAPSYWKVRICPGPNMHLKVDRND